LSDEITDNPVGQNSSNFPEGWYFN
jgi:hypothetical protein